MDLNLYISRCVFLVLLTFVISACSRSNDVTIPAQPVASDVDCSVPAFSSFVVTQIEGMVLSKEGVDDTVFSLPGTNGDLFEQTAATLLKSIGFRVSAVSNGDSLTLVDGDVVEVAFIDTRVEQLDSDLDSSQVNIGDVLYFQLKGGLNRFEFYVRVDFDFVERDTRCQFLGEEQEIDGSSEKEFVRRLSRVIPIGVNVLVDDVVSETTLETSRADFGSSGDNTGAVISADGKLLAIGVPLEDSSSQGIYSLQNYNVDDAAADSGAVYLYRQTDSGWQHTHIIKSSNARAGDRFGSGVIVKGSQLIVSAPYEDRNGGGVYNGTASAQSLAYDKPDSGAIYVFNLIQSDETLDILEAVYIKSIDNPTNLIDPAALFGSSLSLYQDRLLVGAPKQTVIDDASQTVNSGKAYLFERDSQGVWDVGSQFGSLTKRGEDFGASVVMFEDYLVVGAPRDSVGSSDSLQGADLLVNTDFTDAQFDPVLPDSGAAYVYVRDSVQNIWAPQAYLKAPNRDANDRFGAKLAFQGSDLFISAPNEDSASAQSNVDMADNSLQNSGAVYQFNIDIEDSNNVSLVTYLKDPSPTALANFGGALNLDQDHVVIASPNAGLTSGTSKGKVSVFDRSNNFSLVEVLTFEDGDPVAAERFGSSVVIDQGRIFVGAPGATKDSVTSGDVRLFQ
jgi:FG-GAP repeat